MCGIFGRWQWGGGSVDVEAVRRATSLLRHRGPDDEGYLLGATAVSRYVHAGGPDTSAALGLPRVEELAGEGFDLALGFRRLSILDLSPLGHQPMSTPDGRYTLVFNGEVYNYRELRDELAAYGQAFRSDTDTEVVLAAYAAWGPECLHRFNGMWAFAVWDAWDASLFLARDRFGVKPLFYVTEGDAFAFASEIKALVGAHGIPFRPRARAVYEFLERGELPSPARGETFFDDVSALPPGHRMYVRPGGVEVERYYRVPEGAGRPASCAAEASAGFRTLLEDSVRLRLRSDVPVGSCLSGGVDSSAIVGLVAGLMTEQGVARESLGERQKTFSAVYHSQGRYNEREHVDRVLDATGAEGNFVYPTAERLREELARLAWHQDEPFGSTSIFAQWCVMGKARERGVTVLLDGQGADEIQAGYRPFAIFLAELLRTGRWARALSAGREIGRVAGEPVSRLLAQALVRQLPAASLGRLRRERTRGGTTGLRSDFVRAHGLAPRFSPANRRLHDHLRELIEETSLPHLLRYEDRNSMAFSVEGRVPFLDYRLVEYSLGPAYPWCIHGGWAKWVLRDAVAGAVPDEVRWRRDKVGFETPEREWLLGLLTGGGFLEDGSPAAEYLDLAAARREMERWIRHGGSARQIWRWISLELWLRAFASPAATAALRQAA